MKNIIACLLLIFFSTQLFSQKKTLHSPQRTGVTNTTLSGPQPTSSGFNGTGANINVVYHRVNWQINPNGPADISGSVVTYFKTIQPNVAAISFDLSRNAFNNASLIVTYHGINCVTGFPATGNTDVLNISLPAVIAASNTLDSVVINYAGTPEANGLGGGFNQSTYTDISGITQHYTGTLSESYEDRDWWPCKADMQDKIDSMDINVTVPWNEEDTFWVASNGVLVDSALGNAVRTFHYKTRYPIASYLVCFSAAKYNRYYSSVAVGNTVVPVYWYILAGKDPAYYTSAVAAMTKINTVVQAFSSKLGDYPFKNEKHGYYEGLVGATGMEHQTFTAIVSGALTSLATLDHELMHQWFGDNVTFATWNDLWLAEGFARYGEILAPELVPSLGYSGYTRRNNYKNSALSLRNTSLWIPNSNAGNSENIWNSSYGSAVYERGCMVVSMLREMCGDARFFQALKNYQTTLAGRSANADSLKTFFNHALGMDISEFFKDYVGGSGSSNTAVGGIGNPVYEIKWNNPADNKLTLGVQSQSKSNGSNVAYFNGPVAVRVTGNDPATQDTSIVFFDWGSGNLSYAGDGIAAPQTGNVLSYDLSFTPVSIFYDDSAYTLSTGDMVLDTALKGYTWYGAADTDWFNASNWASCCGVPPTNADVTIATILNPPVLPAAVTVKNLTINEGKFISISNKTLTVNGTVSGTGSFKGSAASGLVINGKAGVINFLQSSNSDRSLQSLLMKPGSTVLLNGNLEVTNISIGAAANLVVTPGVNLITH